MPRSSHPPSTCTKTAPNYNDASFLSKLALLRAFVPMNDSLEEADLSACLRQCACNVELAAERLMMGQFQRHSSTFFSMSSSAASTSEKKKNNKEDCNVNSDSEPTAKRARLVKTSNARTVSTSHVIPKKPSAAANTTFLSARKKAPPTTTTKSVTPSPAALHHRNDENHASSLSLLLLCQRWVVGTCTTKHGAVNYEESLKISHSLKGPPMVRFQGSRVEGVLPFHLSALLTPLLRHSVGTSDEDNERSSSDTAVEDTCMVSITAEALMELRGLCIGAEVPVSLKIHLVNARAFFGMFRSHHFENTSSMASQFFGQLKKMKNGPLNKKKSMPLLEAGFGLLQWAEYGEQYHFEPPKEEAMPETNDVTSDSEDGDGDMVVGETQLGGEIGEEATEWAQNLVAGASSSTEASIPEATDPVGFRDGVVLHPYQKQALHWMLSRESGEEHRVTMERELELLSELARNAGQSTPSYGPTVMKDPIMCEVGPVLVSPEASARSKTIDGVENPARHPLWHRRFLATHDMKQAVSFYVNELMGVASAEPPDPPSHCVGGILADAMGLGKTVMLLALILKSKELEDKSPPEAEGGPARASLAIGTTLVVAPLSLISQWEEELASKTALSHKVYYGDSSRGSIQSGSFKNVDVVVTTYGTLQAEVQHAKKKASFSGILRYEWDRAILDEAHCIKNSSTLVSRACCMLKASKRWCVTGTPIQNSLQDIYALLKFLRHEPWCEASFWKAAITSAAELETAEGEGGLEERDQRDTAPVAPLANVAHSRVRRLLAPLILRRTKDSLAADGTPILTLPPVETAVVKVELSPAERDFYNSLLSRSQSVFEGFIKDGTASKSWFAIFSLLHRLRQACDHVALTVKTHMEEADWNPSTIDPLSPAKVAVTPRAKMSPKSKGLVDDAFLEGLLEKFHSKQTHVTAASGPSQDTERKFASQVAHALDDVVKAGATHVKDECALCLDTPRIHDAVLTPCAHVFCRDCLVGMLRDRAQHNKKKKKKVLNLHSKSIQQQTLDCPNGECPICKEPIESNRIIALSSSKDGRTTTSYLADSKHTAHSLHVSSAQAPTPTSTTSTTTTSSSSNVDHLARQTLEHALRGADSAKLKAVMKELHEVWRVNPGSKVLVFSQFLGFLDLLETALRKQHISFGRLDGTLTWKERVSVLESFRRSRTVGKDESTNNNQHHNHKQDTCCGSVLLASMKAGGVGINLTAASCVFLVDPWWNAAVQEQCINRIHRMGQTAAVVRVRQFVVTDSVEERIVSLQRRKQDMARRVLCCTGSSSSSSTGCSGRSSAQQEEDAARPTLDDLKLLFGGG